MLSHSKRKTGALRYLMSFLLDLLAAYEAFLGLWMLLSHLTWKLISSGDFGDSGKAFDSVNFLWKRLLVTDCRVSLVSCLAFFVLNRPSSMEHRGNLPKLSHLIDLFQDVMF